MKISSAIALSCLIAAVSMTGCEKITPIVDKLTNRNWLVGTWVLDREKTMAAFTQNNQKEVPMGGVAGEIAAAAIRKTVEAAISPLDNATFIFTDTEYSETFRGRTGKPKTYEIVSRPGPGQIKTLDSNKVVNIYNKDGEHIWYNLRGNDKIQIYLKRANP